MTMVNSSLVPLGKKCTRASGALVSSMKLTPRMSMRMSAGQFLEFVSAGHLESAIERIMTNSALWFFMMASRRALWQASHQFAFRLGHAFLFDGAVKTRARPWSTSGR